MNLPALISARISGNKASSFSRLITKLAIVATALSVAVMIVSMAVVQGFKDNIYNKMFVFWGHFHVALANPNPSSVIAAEPMADDAQLKATLLKDKDVVALYPFAVKPAIINDNNIVEGIKLKGVDKTYPFKSDESIEFKGKALSFLQEGYAQEIILSNAIMQKLKKQIGESVLIYFINSGQDAPSVRKLKIVGTYKTGVDEIDRSFALCDINLIRKVSQWDSNAINGYQIFIDDFKKTDSIAYRVYQDYLEPPLTYNTIGEIYPDIQNWLALIDVNTNVIMLIMSIVAIINMATALLIFILERTNMIGILKSMGMSNGKLWRIFLYHSFRVLLIGVSIGALVGIAFCALQYFTHFIKLGESTYYVPYVPVRLLWWHVLGIVVGTIILSIFTLMIPALLVRSINVVKALRFK